ncbi:MAG: extracellular solute-binding protein, partial [Paenibacillaceae bacterium]|nr:extracellular solute-binding protein [Paenibacillaceae bacterium]
MQKGRYSVLVGLSALIVVASACSGNSKEGNEDKQPSASPSASSASSASAKPQPSQNPDFKPLGKYNPPIEMSTVRQVAANQYFDEGETIDKNSLYDFYESQLGIKIKNLWTVSKDYDTKLKLAIASDELPDFFKVSPVDLLQLVENGMVADLTEAWDKTASDAFKKWVGYDGGIQMKSATFGGKLMAIPETRSGYGDLGILYVRKDWLKEMNLPEPKTMADLLKISKAFSQRDSGGKGKTYGLFLDKTLGLKNFYNGYHLYPKTWVKDSAGNLSYGSLDPRMKDALKELQTMFKDGQIDPEFGVKDRVKALELVNNNRVGIMYGRYSDTVALTGAIVNNKVVQEWESYMIPSIDDKPAQSQVSANVQNYFVASKKSKHPEALIKIADLSLAPTIHQIAGSNVLATGKNNKTDQIIYTINPITLFGQLGPVEMGELIPKAEKLRDPSVLKGQWPNVYKNMMNFINGDINIVNYANYMNGKDGGTLAKVYQGYQQNLFKFDEFYGAPTPTMGEK